MKRGIGLLIGALAGTLACPLAVHAQHMAHMAADIQGNLFLNGMEIATGVVASVMAFQAAMAYREGLLGRGMTWVAVGMVIMGVGHFILVFKRVTGIDPLGFFGATGSFVAFSLAVFASFIASALGFWIIRRAVWRDFK